MRLLMALCAAGAGLSGCVDDAIFVLVFRSGPVIEQCGFVVVTPEQSAAQLQGAGVEVLRSRCGAVSGISYPAVCGAPTGSLILHDIPATSLPVALANGFRLAKDLEDPQQEKLVVPVPCG